MNSEQVKKFNMLYQRHLSLLKLQGKSQKTIDAYYRAVRRVREKIFLYNLDRACLIAGYGGSSFHSHGLALFTILDSLYLQLDDNG